MIVYFVVNCNRHVITVIVLSFPRKRESSTIHWLIY